NCATEAMPNGRFLVGPMSATGRLRRRPSAICTAPFGLQAVVRCCRPIQSPCSGAFVFCNAVRGADLGSVHITFPQPINISFALLLQSEISLRDLKSLRNARR